MTSCGLLRIKLTLDFHAPVPKPSECQHKPTTKIATKKGKKKKNKTGRGSVKKTQLKKNRKKKAKVQSNGEDSDSWMHVNASERVEDDVSS